MLRRDKSLSARRAWIEMCFCWRQRQFSAVALRKESVDRNNTVQIKIVKMHVALRKESVDRNIINEKPVTDQDGSLSARRAWIEIL